MEKINVLIVEDEPIAQDILAAYIARIDSLHLVGRGKNALEAFALLSKESVDLLLLDINMPEMSGIDFLKTIPKPPLVIFTTAYPDFAIESYDLNAVDYLLKPIPFGRFLKAINKATAMIGQRNATNESAPEMAAGAPISAGNILFVKSEGKLVKIDIPDICFVEGLKDYMRIRTEQAGIIVHGTLNKMEEQLTGQGQNFVRINKSYIVNLRHVSAIEGNRVHVKDFILPIGSTYRESVLRLLQSHRLL